MWFLYSLAFQMFDDFFIYHVITVNAEKISKKAEDISERRNNNHELALAQSALVMLLRNLDADAGLCNGVRAIVTHAERRVLDVMLVSGSRAGARAFIPRLVLAPKNPDLPFVLRRRQFPVKLAWCMTLNKAQGQTLQQVGLYLQESCFSHGQFYVGCSRVGTDRNLKVFCPNQRTKNVVYPEALGEIS